MENRVRTYGVLNQIISNKQLECVILVCLKYVCVDFMTRIWFWAYVRLKGPRCDFCEKKKLRKNIYREAFSSAHDFSPVKVFT